MRLLLTGLLERLLLERLMQRLLVLGHLLGLGTLAEVTADGAAGNGGPDSPQGAAGDGFLTGGRWLQSRR